MTHFMFFVSHKKVMNLVFLKFLAILNSAAGMQCFVIELLNTPASYLQAQEAVKK